MIKKVIISLASNCDQEQNMQEARLRIAALDKLNSLQYTEAIWTKPYGSVVGEASKLCSNLSLQSSEASPTTLQSSEASPTTLQSSEASPTMYLNQLVCAETTLEVEELIQTLKDIEQQMGRTQEDRRQGIVRIDLDLLLYGEQRYHLKDWDRPYIKALLPK